jgi:hypothetical protein
LNSKISIGQTKISIFIFQKFYFQTQITVLVIHSFWVFALSLLEKESRLKTICTKEFEILISQVFTKLRLATRYKRNAKTERVS